MIILYYSRVYLTKQIYLGSTIIIADLYLQLYEISAPAAK